MLAKMAHHTLYDISGTFQYDDELDGKFKEINLKAIKADWDRKEKKRLNELRSKIKDKARQTQINIKNARPTGRKVRILDIYAHGQEWSVLKRDMVVDELDCIFMDTDPSTGVWVMGRTEPVKLLNNDSQGTEWEYVEPDCLGLALEILSMMGQRSNRDWIGIMPHWINRVVPTILHGDMGEGTLWRQLTDLLDSHGVPRRHFRHLINDKLVKWGKDHSFFGDDRVEIWRECTKLQEKLYHRQMELDMIKAEKEKEKLEQFEYE
jgi:hypothetical protein